MKKIYSIIICATCLFPLAGFGQLKIIGKNIVQGAFHPNNQYNTYAARDTIRLKPGFNSSNVAQRPFTAYIDESLIFPVDYETNPINPDTRELDFSKVVGSIAGNADVSPTGAATYQIPIFTPPGTVGMEPQISIAYNSQGGNGALGVGWDVAGLSVITRAPQTIYHDGQVRGVDLSSEDRFALDGNRLILLTGTYGAIGSTYATEIETYSKITTSDAGNNNCKFEVKTKNGETMEYGYTGDSRINIDLKILLWRLNKITDVNGNYVSYFYGEDNRESWIEKIEYTGNTSAGLAPYNTITFLYADRLDVQEGYVAGNKVQNKKILRGIKVESEGAVVRRYWFKYHKDFYTHLVEIVEEGSDGSSPNSTIVEWGKNPNVPFQYKLCDVARTSSESIVTFSDLNSDGREDFITIDTDAHQWKVYFADNSLQGYTKHYQKAFNQEANITIEISKPDKKGFPHVFIGERITVDDGDCENNSNNFRCSKQSYSEYAFYNMDNPTWIGENHAIYKDRNHSYNDYLPVFRTGDAYGDGTVHYMYTNSRNMYWQPGFPGYPVVDNETYNVINTNLYDANHEWINFNGADDFLFFDFNGDGADELMVVKGINYTIYDYDNTGTHHLIHSGVFPGSLPFLIPADFNADGKVDLLVRQSGNFYVYLSDQNSFRKINTHAFIDSGSSNLSVLKIGDVNGDGKTDIIRIYDKSIRVYYSIGDGAFEQETYDFSLEFEGNTTFNSMQSFHMSDYNGDGKMEFIFAGATKIWIATLYKSKEYINRIKSITNGLNYKTQFEYESLSKGGDFYTKETTTPTGTGVINFQGPIYAVSKMTAPNGIGGANSMTFSYKGAKIHRLGKGFLGFSEVTTTNVVNNAKNINKYDYNPTYFNVYLKESQTKLISGEDVGKTISANNVYDFGNKRIFPYIESSESTDYLTGNKETNTFVYDVNNGNITSKKTVYGYSSVLTVTTDFTYESFGNWGKLNKLTLQKTTSKHVNHNENYVRKMNYGYDNKGNLISETADNGVVTQYQNLNAFGLARTITTTAPDALAYTKTLTYDNAGRFALSTADALGTTSTIYDAATGNVISETGIDGLTAKYKYDGFGRLIASKTPEGHIVETSYKWKEDNAIKSLTSAETTAPGRPKQISCYDILGREVRSMTEGFSGAVTTDQMYSAKGQLQKTSQPSFGTPSKWIENSYDDYGRITTVTDKTGTAERVTQYTYEGNTAKVTMPDAKKSIAKTYNAHGGLIKVVENNITENTMTYEYHSNGQVKTVLWGTTPTIMVSMEYDTYGRQTALNDPDAGRISYTYNALGDVLTQTDAQGITTTTTYDNLGRVLNQSKSNGEPTKTYTYNTSGVENGKLQSIKSSVAELLYDYGDYGRLTKLTEKLVGSESFVTQYEYDQYGNKTGITYPGGFKVKREYNAIGYVTKIKQGDNSADIWTRQTENALGQPLKYKMGNEKITEYAYNTYNLPTRVYTTGVQDFSYDIDPKNGNMNWRRDNLKGLTENFSYGQDGYDRLINASLGSTSTLVMQYEPNGNMKAKNDIGTYQYQHANKVHALTGITEPLPTILNSGNQELVYNSFNKATRINQIFEGSPVKHRLDIDYGIDQERIRTRYYQTTATAVLQQTKYFAASYEKIIDHTNGNATKEINYISTPYGTLAAYIVDNGIGQMYYLYKDHLGSITTITNQVGTAVERRSFDAWGRPRNPDNWTFTNVSAMTILDRGYTGHEHLQAFGLINMNGRLYDPLTARMLSPDPYVTAPDNTQGYNRYAYCMNNPLKYTDPSGEFVQLIIGAIVAGIMNTMIYSAQHQGKANFGQLAGAFGVGALSALAGAGIGQAVSNSIVAGGFAGGSMVGFAAGSIGGFVGGFGNSLISGSNFGDALKSGFITGGISGLTAGLLGGFNQGYTDWKNGYSFGNGSRVSEISVGEANLGTDKEQYIKNAELYNSPGNSRREVDTEILQGNVKDISGMEVGDMGMEAIETNVPAKYGITNDGTYVNLKTGNQAAGVTTRYAKGTSYVRISPKFMNTNWVIKHELIHAYHSYHVPNFDLVSSERYAYRHTYQVAISNRNFLGAQRIMFNAMSQGFWGAYPDAYKIPLVYRFMIP